jgi:hypothetical protein
MFSLIENAKIVNVLSPIDKTGGALGAVWVSMKDAAKASFLFQTGVMTSTDNQAVTLYVADDASGTHNAAIGANADLTMPYVYKRTVNTDTWVKTTVASSTFNLTKSSDGRAFMIEVDAQKLGNFTASSVSYAAKYVRLAIGSPGAHACLMAAQCILTGLRYQEDSPPTAIT